MSARTHVIFTARRDDVAVPHSPQRLANTVGFVVERTRAVDDVDVMRWYCENATCRRIVYEERFSQYGAGLDLGKLLGPIMDVRQARSHAAHNHATPSPPSPYPTHSLTH